MGMTSRPTASTRFVCLIPSYPPRSGRESQNSVSPMLNCHRSFQAERAQVFDRYRRELAEGSNDTTWTSFNCFKMGTPVTVVGESLHVGDVDPGTTSDFQEPFDLSGGLEMLADDPVPASRCELGVGVEQTPPVVHINPFGLGLLVARFGRLGVESVLGRLLCHSSSPAR